MTMFGVTLPAFFQGLLFWAISLSFSPFLLLFLNRAVRSIGPALLAMMLVAMIGGNIGAGSGQYAGRHGRRRFSARGSRPACGCHAPACCAGRRVGNGAARVVARSAVAGCLRGEVAERQ